MLVLVQPCELTRWLSAWIVAPFCGSDIAPRRSPPCRAHVWRVVTSGSFRRSPWPRPRARGGRKGWSARALKASYAMPARTVSPAGHPTGSPYVTNPGVPIVSMLIRGYVVGAFDPPQPGMAQRYPLHPQEECQRPRMDRPPRSDKFAHHHVVARGAFVAYTPGGAATHAHRLKTFPREH